MRFLALFFFAAAVSAAQTPLNCTGTLAKDGSVTLSCPAAAQAAPTPAPEPVQAAFPGTTWWVRKDGGTRYSAYLPVGQCDGRSDAPYPGKGVNQHCAWNTPLWLTSTGEYDNGTNQGWAIAGGDTVILRDGPWRLGWDTLGTQLNAEWTAKLGRLIYFGAGNVTGLPVPPAGTAAQPTRILGENYASCHDPAKRTQIFGGLGMWQVVDLTTAQHVRLGCIDVSDHSACGRSNQTAACTAGQDWANTGIELANTNADVQLTDVRLHGMASAGMHGPSGDGFAADRLEIVGNAAAGWNADNGTVGVGTANVANFNISWNGCAEEYPLVHALPYSDCTDDNVGGYGDGFGTATIVAARPWNVTFDTGVVSFNTQDGLDALHLVGAGSSMTIRNVQAYSNMGQQLKNGGSGGVIDNSTIVGNCRAMQQAIPGTPEGYNKRLSDFCRAADTTIALSVSKGATTAFTRNTVYSASATMIEIDPDNAIGADGTAAIRFEGNTLYGYPASNGQQSNAVYLSLASPFGNAGSTLVGNLLQGVRTTLALGTLLTGTMPVFPAYGPVP